MHGRLSKILVFTSLILLGGSPRGYCDLTFQYLTTHPDAIGQPTVRGRTLSNISVFESQLFFGYGDWAADTGPMTIRSFSSTSGLWSSSLLTFGSEAISHYRQIANRLYAVNVDPLGLPQANPGGFARGEPSGGGNSSWTQFATVPATHDFDMASRDGSDLWVVGSQNTLASIWRSTDGGLSFGLARQDAPAPGSPSFVFSRYTGVAVFNNVLYVQRTDVNGADVSSSLTFDGNNWAVGPDLLSASNGYLVRPSQFNGMLVYLDSDLGDGNLYKFDGANSNLAYSLGVRDYFLHNGKVYALTADNQIVSSSDLSSWELLGTAPADSRSLGLFDDKIFVGTTSATVFWSPQSSITAVPEVSSIWLIAMAVALGWVRKRRAALGS